MNQDIQIYIDNQEDSDNEICKFLYDIIEKNLLNSESKIWHAHPVWFIDGNPIVGFSKQKKGIRLMFWSGADFEEEKLNVLGEKFKDASIFYRNRSEIISEDLIRWIMKAENIQWDYKNLIKRKGVLERIN